MSVKLSRETRDKLGEVKIKFDFKETNAGRLIKEICEKLLEFDERIKRLERESVIDLYNIIEIVEEIFVFLQEKCREKDYLEESFFKKLMVLERLACEQKK